MSRRQLARVTCWLAAGGALFAASATLGQPAAPAPEATPPAAPSAASPDTAPAAAPSTAPAAPPPPQPALPPAARVDLPPAATQPPLPSARVQIDPQPEEREERKHGHVLSRFTLGGGVGNLGAGSIGPAPGFKPIHNLDHWSPVLGMAGYLGFGGNNLAISGELLYHVLLSQTEKPSHVFFQIFGAGIGGSYYFQDDWNLTAHLRWNVLWMYRSDMPCFFSCWETTAGPGVGVSFGKEWFRPSGGGTGVALQVNYAHFQGYPDLQYLSVLLNLTLTRF